MAKKTKAKPARSEPLLEAAEPAAAAPLDTSAGNVEGGDTLTADALRKYFAKNQERKEHQRQADNLEKELKPLKRRLLAAIREKCGAGPIRALTLFGFLLRIKTVPGRVNWAEKCAELLGADEVTRLQRLAEPIEYPDVELLTEVPTT